MNIRVEKVGGIWHGTIDGHPEIDERGLTEEIARRKVNSVAVSLTKANDDRTRGVADPLRALPIKKRGDG
jgi:hypothetical protein